MRLRTCVLARSRLTRSQPKRAGIRRRMRFRRVDEAGLPGLHTSVWNALWVPKRTAKEVITKLNAAAVEALADPTVRQLLGERGLEIPPRDQQTPEALGAFQKAEIEKWWPIIKAAIP